MQIRKYSVYSNVNVFRDIIAHSSLCAIKLTKKKKKKEEIFTMNNFRTSNKLIIITSKTMAELALTNSNHNVTCTSLKDYSKTKCSVIKDSKVLHYTT